MRLGVRCRFIFGSADAFEVFGFVVPRRALARLAEPPHDGRFSSHEGVPWAGLSSWRGWEATYCPVFGFTPPSGISRLSPAPEAAEP